MNPSIRLANESDAETLFRLMREYYTFDGHYFDPDKAREALLQLLREPAFGLVWLISDETTIIGYVVLCFGYSLEFHGRDAFLDEFYLKADYRRRGAGAHVLNQIEERARRKEFAPSISKWSDGTRLPVLSTGKSVTSITITA